jgi:hypothetical protein
MFRILILFLFLGVSACRFVVPGSSETAVLESRGAFSGGAPAWAKLPKESSNVLPGRSGIMSRTHTIPQGMSMSSAANASSATAPHVGRGFSRDDEASPETEDRFQRKVEVATPEDSAAERDSIIGRIEYECPGTESAVVSILKTESVQERIRKYLALTRKCPYSAEIWVLLAREYKDLKRYSDARRCLQAALAIDPEHEEAKGMLDSLLKSSDKNPG